MRLWDLQSWAIKTDVSDNRPRNLELTTDYEARPSPRATSARDFLGCVISGNDQRDKARINRPVADSAGTGCGSSVPTSVAKVVRHTHADFARSEEQGGLDEQGGLVVQEVLPPVGRDEFGDDDGQVTPFSLTLHPVDVV